MKHEIKLHPLSVKGKFYVDVNNCLICGRCDEIAPNNFKLGHEYEDNYGAYALE